MSEIISSGKLVGATLLIADIVQTLPSYPDGRRPRPRTAARRLAPILQLVSRGPNGSLGNGATYRIVPPIIPGLPLHTQDIVEIPHDEEWLLQSIEKMTTKL